MAGLSMNLQWSGSTPFMWYLQVVIMSYEDVIAFYKLKSHNYPNYDIAWTHLIKAYTGFTIVNQGKTKTHFVKTNDDVIINNLNYGN